MPLTTRQNGTTSANLVVAQWWNDYQELLTGTMIDQPVNIANTFTVSNPIDDPASAPTALAAAGTTLGIGVYKYAVAFGYNGGVSLPSATITVTTTSGNQAVALSSIPTGAYPVSSRILYRTAVGGTQLYQLAVINDNTTTTYTDTIADASLGATVPVTSSTISGAIQVKDNAGHINAVLTSDGTLTIKGLIIAGSSGINASEIDGSAVTLSTTPPASPRVNDIWIPTGSSVNYIGGPTYNAVQITPIPTTTTTNGSIGIGTSTLDNVNYQVGGCCLQIVLDAPTIINSMTLPSAFNLNMSGGTVYPPVVLFIFNSTGTMVQCNGWYPYNEYANYTANHDIIATFPPQVVAYNTTTPSYFSPTGTPVLPAGTYYISTAPQFNSTTVSTAVGSFLSPSGTTYVNLGQVGASNAFLWPMVGGTTGVLYSGSFDLTIQVGSTVNYTPIVTAIGKTGSMGSPGTFTPGSVWTAPGSSLTGMQFTLPWIFGSVQGIVSGTGGNWVPQSVYVFS